MADLLLRRTNTETGAVFEDVVAAPRNAGTRVAWCAGDNLAMTRAEAAIHARAAEAAFERGETYTLARYTFTLKGLPQ